MSAFKKLKEKAIAQGVGLYQQIQTEAQQFQDRQNPASPYHVPAVNSGPHGNPGAGSSSYGASQPQPPSWHQGGSAANSVPPGQQQIHPGWISGQPGLATPGYQAQAPPPDTGYSHGPPPSQPPQPGAYQQGYYPPPPPPASIPAPAARSHQGEQYPYPPPPASVSVQAPAVPNYPQVQTQSYPTPQIHIPASSSGPPSASAHPYQPTYQPPQSPSYPSHGGIPPQNKQNRNPGVDNLSSQFTNFTISQASNAPPPITFKEPPMPPPPMREDGEPNPSMYDCPGPSRLVDYTTTWYRLPDIPDFLVCTQCYAKHIASTTHDATFVKTESQGSCRFNVPRITKTLWPEAYRTGDIRPVRDYMTKRLGITPCPGSSGDATGEMQWYEAVNGQIPGFRACGACYEDLVCGTPLAGYFQPGNNGTGVCHMHFPYLVRALAECVLKPSHGWTEFAGAAAVRMALPECDGNPVAAHSQSWRRLRRQTPSVTICETCFLDQVGMTPFAHEFETIPVPAPGPATTSKTSRFINALVGPTSTAEARTCQAQLPSMAILLNAALQRQDFSIFLTGATTIVSSPPCTENGIQGGRWYVLRNISSSTFKICPSCFAGFLAPYNLAPFFLQTTEAETHLCAFHPTAPHFLPSLLRLQEAIDTGVWTPFSRFVSRVETPPCPRATLVPDRIWYGYQDCGICPACYTEVCAGTVLADKMPIRAARVTGPTMCSMYSPRMRALYADACARNNPDQLIEYAHTRALMHANTLLKADAIRQIRDMKMMAAAHQGSVAAMYSAGQSFSLAAGTTSAYAYGGGNLGWHPTQSGALAAQARRDMQEGFAGADVGGTALEIAGLEAKWAEYE